MKVKKRIKVKNRDRRNNMKLSNQVYDIFKWGLIIFIPAVITLIGSLGQIYGFDTEKIVLTISAISTFLGVITGISNYNYNKGDE